MVSGLLSLIFLIIIIGLVIFLTGKFRINAFIVILTMAILYGLSVGLSPIEIIDKIKIGYSETLKHIGIIIIFGTIIGTVLDKSGGAISITNEILHIFGKKNTPLAMSISGYIISLLIFCDSGYIILSPLIKNISKKTRISIVVISTSLATGLYTSVCLMPPTPGPLASLGILGIDIGSAILYAFIVSSFSLFGGYLWSILVTKIYENSFKEDKTYSNEEVSQTDENNLPSVFLSILPIVVPILLILFKSLIENIFIKYKILPTLVNIYDIFRFLGEPIIALFIGIIFSLFLVKKHLLKVAIKDWFVEGIKNSALILAVIGAGGSFGKIIEASPFIDFLTNNLSSLNIGIFLPFVIALVLKISIGSSTVSIITTSTLMLSLMDKIGLSPILTFLAICSGSMIVTYVNDSYFWIIQQITGLKVSEVYKTITIATLIQGIFAIAIVLVLSLFI